MESEKSIIIKIQIEELIKKTIENNPTSECEFNNLLFYNVANLLLDSLNNEVNTSELLNNGVSKRSSRKRQNKSKINKMKKNSKKKKNVKITNRKQPPKYLFNI